MAISESDKAILKSCDPTITSIDLSNGGLNDNNMSELQELLQGNVYITSINLAHNNIASVGCQMLRLIPGLKSVDLSENQIGDEGLTYLIGTKIESLDVSSCGITKEGADLLLAAIDQFKKLELLKNPRIPEVLLYQIRKKFIPGLTEPGSNPLPPGVGIDLGLNIFCTPFDNTPIEIIPATEKPYEKKQGEAESMAKFGLNRSSDGTKEPRTPPAVSSSLDDTARFLSKLSESEYSEVLLKAEEMRAQQASRQKLISSK